MPQRAPSACRRPGCPGLVRAGMCSVCGVLPQRSRWDDAHASRNESSRHARGYGNDWLRLRKRVLEAENYLCRECAMYGRITPATQVDHITPKAWGGTDDLDNLQPLCDECHAFKTRQEVERGRLQRSCVPVTIITGPPGAGKSTYVERIMQPGDLVVDVDSIFKALSNLAMYDSDRSALLPFVLDARWAILDRLAKPSRVRCAWILTTEGNANKLRRMIDDLGARLVVIRTDHDECLRRIAGDPRRTERSMPWDDLVSRWWRQWAATSGDELPATVVSG